MCYLIIYNPDIEGINIGENEFNITQFTDNTTVFWMAFNNHFERQSTQLKCLGILWQKLRILYS